VYHFKQLVGRFVFYTIGHTSRYVITDTDFTKKEYVNFAHIPINKVTAIHLAADNIPGVPEQPQGFVKSDNFLLYVGQQNDYKNIKNLIRSHRQLKRKHPNLKLVLVGSLNEAAKRNKAWAEKENFQDVIFTGFLPDNELAWLYTNTAAYVFPSLMEGFGLPGLEAMGYGAPVVSSNATCLPEVYGDAAHYFNPSDTDDMARAIDEVLSDKALRDSLIQKGYEQVKKYSWEDVARKTLAVYERVLSEK
jgi:glycosyltransferase involved in cell wall biosynthesis